MEPNAAMLGVYSKWREEEEHTNAGKDAQHNCPR